MIEIFDDFGAHLNNPPTLKKWLYNKILSLKEEGNSSSFNQAYDKEVAKSDKNIQLMNLSYLWQDFHYNRSIVNQWKPLCYRLAIVRRVQPPTPRFGKAPSGLSIFIQNMITRFKAWCKKLAPFMKAVDSFNLVTQSDNNFNVYTLLPCLWQVISLA